MRSRRPSPRPAPTSISFHPDASTHVDRTLQLIRGAGCKAGLVFNPATPLDVLDWVLDKVDLRAGDERQPGLRRPELHRLGAAARSSRLRERIDASGRDIRLEVDGGIKVDNIRAAADAGCDTFVAGSAIFGAARLPRGDRRDARAAGRLSRWADAPWRSPRRRPRRTRTHDARAHAARADDRLGAEHAAAHGHGTAAPRPRLRDRHRRQRRLRRRRGVLRLARRFAGAARRRRPQPRRRARPRPRLGRRIRRPARARRAPHLGLEAGLDPGRVRQRAAAAGRDRLARLGRDRLRLQAPAADRSRRR